MEISMGGVITPLMIYEAGGGGMKADEGGMGRDGAGWAQGGGGVEGGGRPGFDK